MFSLIRSNQRKSAILIVLMGFLFLLIGFGLGGWVDPGAGFIGMGVAFALWLILLLISFSGGESMLMAQAGGREIVKADAPQLFNIVEEMTIAAGLSQPPKVFVIDSTVPNAFAVGRNEQRAAVAVTTGLMARLNRDELQGVIAHEIAHIKHRDTMFMTIAGTTLGAIVIIADLFMRGLRYQAATSRRNSKDNAGGLALMMVLALVFAIIAPILARLLYFACSRRREYLADAGSAQFTRYPEGLASALEKISGAQDPDPRINRVLEPMYIISPQAARGQSAGWFSTHPSTEERVNILRGMTSNSSLAAYEAAYKKLSGGKTIINEIPAEAPSQQPVRPPVIVPPILLPTGWRTARGLLHQTENTRAIDCPCGLKIRIPPAWQNTTITCPRCGRVHET